MTNEEMKRTLWDAADKLRGSVSAAQYKYPVLGLVFLKYVSDMFDAQSQVIRYRLAEPRSEYYIEDQDARKESENTFVSDKTFYDVDNVFWVPHEAPSWSRCFFSEGMRVTPMSYALVFTEIWAGFKMKM